MARVTGAKQHSARLKAMTSEQMARDIGKALYVAGDMIKADAQISITSGSVSGKNHRPSLAGFPPNNDTGVLANNIETVMVEPLKVEVTSNARSSDRDGGSFGPGRDKTSGSVPVAVLLEFGSSKMAARPYMRPAAQKNRKSATDLVARAIRTAVRRSGGNAS